MKRMIISKVNQTGMRGEQMDAIVVQKRRWLRPLTVTSDFYVLKGFVGFGPFFVECIGWSDIRQIIFDQSYGGNTHGRMRFQTEGDDGNKNEKYWNDLDRLMRFDRGDDSDRIVQAEILL